ncbi:MAG: hypothetical protein ACT4SY_06120 [Hyphomicrobiales bacterium]
MNCFQLVIAASLLGLTAASAQAEEFPKSGSTKTSGYMSGTVIDELEGWDAEWQPNVYVATAIVRNAMDGGPFDKSFVRCIGQQAMIAGKFSSSGACTQIDEDGDKIFITSEPDSFNFIGGTGKYQGITGGGTYNGYPVFQGKKNWAVYVSYESHWEIKLLSHAEGSPLYGKFIFH